MYAFVKFLVWQMQEPHSTVIPILTCKHTKECKGSFWIIFQLKFNVSVVFVCTLLHWLKESNASRTLMEYISYQDKWLKEKNPQESVYFYCQFYLSSNHNTLCITQDHLYFWDNLQNPFFFYSRQIQIIILINIVLLRLLLLICWTCLDWNIQAWKIEFKLILLYFSNMNHSLRIESFIHYHHPNFVYNFKFFLRVTYPPSNGRSRSFII